MPLPPVPNTMKVEATYVWLGQIVQNVYHVEKATSLTVSDADNIQFAWETYWAIMSVYSSTTIRPSELYMTDLTTNSSPTYTYNTSTAPAGEQTGQSMPCNVSIVASHRTNGRGRSFRGRSYIPGLPEALVDGNTVVDVFISAVVNAWNDMRENLETNDLNLVVVSYYTGKALRPAPVTSNITTTVVTDNVVDSQRRRLPGRGR